MSKEWDLTGGRAVMSGAPVVLSTVDGPVDAEILVYQGNGRAVLVTNVPQPQPRDPNAPYQQHEKPASTRHVGILYDESGAPGTWNWPG